MRLTIQNEGIATQGVHDTTILAVKDIGMVETKYGPRQQMQITFRVDDQTGSDGRPVEIQQLWTKSIRPNSAFYKFLKGLGIACTDFDTDTLLGLQCRVQVYHSLDNYGSQYAHVGEGVAVLGKVELPPVLIVEATRHRRMQAVEVVEPSSDQKVVTQNV